MNYYPIRVKVFNADSIARLEADMNQMLETNPAVEVIWVTQSESGKHGADWAITVTLAYRDVLVENPN